ncbi:MAG TPA: type II toxin-antitoxin system Phd/YefM family antitoxin [Actinomycetales bacterium]|nr:type II toxin-antitoxin system Phd/YefM family antitoxin [Actinomycetales bacterium]
MATLSAREFNRDVSAAKRAAEKGPVVITDRGSPSHVLMSIGEFRRLSGGEPDLVAWLSMDDDGVAFEPGPIRLGLRAPDL